jgi:hypothetical protein
MYSDKRPYFMISLLWGRRDEARLVERDVTDKRGAVVE